MFHVKRKELYMENNENEVEFVNCDGQIVKRKNIVLSKLKDDNSVVYIAYSLTDGAVQKDYINQVEFERLLELRDVSHETKQEVPDYIRKFQEHFKRT